MAPPNKKSPNNSPAMKLDRLADFDDNGPIGDAKSAKLLSRAAYPSSPTSSRPADHVAGPSEPAFGGSDVAQKAAAEARQYASKAAPGASQNVEIQSGNRNISGVAHTDKDGNRVLTDGNNQKYAIQGTANNPEQHLIPVGSDGKPIADAKPIPINNYKVVSDKSLNGTLEIPPNKDGIPETLEKSKVTPKAVSDTAPSQQEAKAVSSTSEPPKTEQTKLAPIVSEPPKYEVKSSPWSAETAKLSGSATVIEHKDVAAKGGQGAFAEPHKGTERAQPKYEGSPSKTVDSHVQPSKSSEAKPSSLTAHTPAKTDADTRPAGAQPREAKNIDLTGRSDAGTMRGAAMASAKEDRRIDVVDKTSKTRLSDNVREPLIDKPQTVENRDGKIKPEMAQTLPLPGEHIDKSLINRMLGQPDAASGKGTKAAQEIHDFVQSIRQAIPDVRNAVPDIRTICGEVQTAIREQKLNPRLADVMSQPLVRNDAVQMVAQLKDGKNPFAHNSELSAKADRLIKNLGPDGLEKLWGVLSNRNTSTPRFDAFFTRFQQNSFARPLEELVAAFRQIKQTNKSVERSDSLESKVQPRRVDSVVPAKPIEIALLAEVRTLWRNVLNTVQLDSTGKAKGSEGQPVRAAIPKPIATATAEVKQRKPQKRSAETVEVVARSLKSLLERPLLKSPGQAAEVEDEELEPANTPTDNRRIGKLIAQGQRGDRKAARKQPFPVGDAALVPAGGGELYRLSITELVAEGAVSGMDTKSQKQPDTRKLPPRKRRRKYVTIYGDTVRSIALKQIGHEDFADLVILINKNTLLAKGAVGIDFAPAPGTVLWLPSDSEKDNFREFNID